jgi:hypothetical protein
VIDREASPSFGAPERHAAFGELPRPRSRRATRERVLAALDRMEPPAFASLRTRELHSPDAVRLGEPWVGGGSAGARAGRTRSRARWRRGRRIAQRSTSLRRRLSEGASLQWVKRVTSERVSAAPPRVNIGAMRPKAPLLRGEDWRPKRASAHWRSVLPRAQMGSTCDVTRMSRRRPGFSRMPGA